MTDSSIPTFDELVDAMLADPRTTLESRLRMIGRQFHEVAEYLVSNPGEYPTMRAMAAGVSASIQSEAVRIEATANWATPSPDSGIPDLNSYRVRKRK